MSLKCASEEALRNNIRQALQLENVIAKVNFHRIDKSEADSLGLKGSPTLLINGKELQPADVSGFS